MGAKDKGSLVDPEGEINIRKPGRELTLRAHSNLPSHLEIKRPDSTVGFSPVRGLPQLLQLPMCRYHRHPIYTHTIGREIENTWRPAFEVRGTKRCGKTTSIFLPCRRAERKIAGQVGWNRSLGDIVLLFERDGGVVGWEHGADRHDWGWVLHWGFAVG